MDFATSKVTVTTSFAIPVSPATADFDEDGKADIIMVNADFPNDLTLLIGTGDTTFQPQQPVEPGVTSFALTVGDFNRDGHADVAVTDAGNGVVSVLFGDGHGGFLSGGIFTTVDGGGPIQAGDFNHDGNLDLAVISTSADQGCVLLGDVHGHFGAPLLFTAPAQPSSPTAAGTFALGDLDGDGKLDLAVADGGANTVVVLEGDGHGHLGSPKNLPTGTDPASVGTGDFNRDGKLDIAVANAGSSDVSVILGTGHGSFAPARSYPAPTGPVVIPSLPPAAPALLVRDLDHDSKLDLVVTNGAGDGVGILFGRPDGTFGALTTYRGGRQPNGIVAAAFDSSNRWIDLAITSAPDQAVRVLRNGPRGIFVDAPVAPTDPEPIFVAAGDFDNDCKPDLAVANDTSNSVNVLLNNGDGTFRQGQTFEDLSFADWIAVADINQDGNLDLVVAASGVSVLLGNGNGTFQPAQTFADGSSPDAVLVADFNCDGKPDIADIGFSQLNILLNTGNRHHLDFEVLDPNFDGGGFAGTVGDFNKDGHPDLAITPFGAGTINILLGAADCSGGMQLAQTLPAFQGEGYITTGDLDGDGNLDLVAGAFFQGMEVLLGNGDPLASFQAPAFVDISGVPEAMALADIDGDGKLDIAAANATRTSMSVLINSSSPGQLSFQPPLQFGTGFGPQGLATADFNRDGRPDFAISLGTEFSSDDSGVSVIIATSP